jgi:hypothetical protein
MMNSKTTNQPRKGDNMTISQYVSAFHQTRFAAYNWNRVSNQIFEQCISSTAASVTTRSPPLGGQSASASASSAARSKHEKNALVGASPLLVTRLATPA